MIKSIGQGVTEMGYLIDTSAFGGQGLGEKNRVGLDRLM
jgi:hypothetical protein